MKIYVANAFSLSMLNRELQSRHDNQAGLYGHKRQPRPVDDPRAFLEDHRNAILSRDLHPTCHWAAIEFLESNKRILRSMVVSIIGHEDTAAVLGYALGIKLIANRQAIQLDEGGRRDYETCVLVGQVMAADGGPYRLPAGATVLPSDAIIEWWVV